MKSGVGMKIVEEKFEHKPQLGDARWFREFNPERCCATCRFFQLSKSRTVWWCFRPNMKPFNVACKNPRGCLCDGWYARKSDS